MVSLLEFVQCCSFDYEHCSSSSVPLSYIIPPLIVRNADLFIFLYSNFYAVCLRLQISEGYVASKSQERAFVDYVLAMTTLFLAAWCYIG
jgi:hypothetical protein